MSGANSSRRRGTGRPERSSATSISASSSGSGHGARSAGCPPCRRAPRPGSRRGRCRRPPRCGGRRRAGRRGPCTRRGRTRRADPAGSTMWSKKGRPVVPRSPRCRPRPATTSIDVSLVGPVHLGRPAGGGRGRGAHCRLSFRAARKRSFSSGSPIVTRRQPREARPSPTQLRTSTERVEQRPPHLSRSPVPWAGTG